MAAPKFKSDIPSEDWLREKLRWTQEDGRNQWGVPKTFGPITGSFDRPLNLPVEVLLGVPGERAEQSNVRPDSLAHIRKNFERVTQDPVYVEVDPYGKAWMSEGNHRIMVAAERGVTHLQAQVRYFSGGEREATDFAPERLMAMDAQFIQKPQPESVVLDEATGGTAAFFDDDAYAVYGIDGKGQVRVQSIAASENIRGRAIVDWIKQTYSKPIVVNEVAVGVEGFWNRMVDEGLVESWSEKRFVGELAQAPLPAIAAVVPQAQPEPKPLNDAARLARYIEPGDSFGERMTNGGGVLGAGVVLSVDRVGGAVRVKYTSGRLNGVEQSEMASDERFSEIVAGRQRRERQEFPPEPSLFAIGDELRGAQRVPLYEPVRFATGDEMASAVLRRGGMADFRGPPSKAVRTETGLSFFEAVSAPGNQTTYTYMLVREVAVLDREAGQIVPSEGKPLVGMTKWDRMEVDQRPGLYYVNARQEGNPPKDALLLGPFEKHLDALLRTQKASNYVAENNRDGVWLSYGTVRLDTTPEAAPRGKLNGVLLTRQERDSLPGAEQIEHDVRIRRLAFVNEWSDGLVAHAREHLQGNPDEVLGAMQRAADDLNLSVLRGGDETLAQRAAATLGFASVDDLRHFQRENPPLSAALKAEPALEGGFGRVVGLSSTEVVFATEHGPMFFERAWLKADVGVGDAIRVGKFGDAEVTAGAPASVYEPGKKYNGLIPEIKYLPVTAIHRQEMDFRPEVMTVSDEVADNMDFSEPVEVTAFRYGPANHDTLPEVTLRDGHHRTAAAIQTGRPHLPVEVKAVNAMGEKLNALIAMSQVIEASLEAEALLSARL